MIATTTLDEAYEDLSPYIGDITPDHVEAFWRDGFVRVPGFVKPELCEKVMAHYMKWTGIRWRDWPDDPVEQKKFVAAIEAMNKKPRLMFAIRQEDPWMFNYVTQRKFGEASARLLKVPSIKVLTETLHAKQPYMPELSLLYPWHQDFPSLPIDRAEAVQFWLALVPITPEMGPMVHLKGSHRSQPAGMMGASGEDAMKLYPEVFEQYEMTKPEHLSQGDGLFHHPLTWHASAPNRTNKVRWAMSSFRISGRCLYTGQQNFNTDGLGLKPNKTFEHDNFPTVYP